MTGFIECSKETYYTKIEPLNVVGRLTTSKWPYTTEHFYEITREVVGRIVGRVNPKTQTEENKYYLKE